MLYSDIPKVLFSSIKKDDPHRDSKLFQIERMVLRKLGFT